MFTDCVVNADTLQTIPKSQIGELITHLSTDRMDEVNQAVIFALGLDSWLDI